MTLQTLHGFTFLPEEDRLRIEEEHARLAIFLRDLRNTCSEFESQQDCHDCGSEKTSSCQGRLASFQFDLLDMVAQHYENEESIMRNNLATPEDGLIFRSHQAEHARILDDIRKNLVRESSTLNRQGNTVAAIRLLYEGIVTIFEAHENEFDFVLPKSANIQKDA